MNVEVSVTLDLGDDAPALLDLSASSLALGCYVTAEDMAATAAEASGGEEAHAAVPHVRYRVGSSEWTDLGVSG